MQIERQIAVFCVLMGGALAYPEVVALAKQPGTLPGAELMTGGGFGALAVFFGTLIALDYDPPWFKYLALGFWCLVSLAFAAAMEFGALRSPGAVRMGLFELFAALAPLASLGTCLGVWVRSRAANDRA
ncbi:MAG TPA: hypothetical protein VGT99_07165 [Gammaproteobacteria bacterium]|nr:hypothetical protein [Gammaproteobacteria bacterium]